MKDARWQLVPDRTSQKNAAEQDAAEAVMNFNRHRHSKEFCMSAGRQFAIVTGASTGIGLELANVVRVKVLIF
jgi:hypothetical protein